jgi:hypothetical protein
MDVADHARTHRDYLHGKSCAPEALSPQSSWTWMLGSDLDEEGIDERIELAARDLTKLKKEDRSRQSLAAAFHDP